MSDVKIQQATQDDERTLPVFADLEQMMNLVRKRAFEIFAERESARDQAMEDWFLAQRDLDGSCTELVEDDQEYRYSVAVPGFDPTEIEVTATPRSLIVHAHRSDRPLRSATGSDEKLHWSEFRHGQICRRIELPSGIDAGKVAASVQKGILTVTAPKVQVAQRVIPVSEAA
jgi:HSP20 family protein